MNLSFPYRPVPISGAAPPSLPLGTTQRFRPFIPVRLIAPDTRGFRDFVALLDTGADDTVFPLDVATMLGLSFVPTSRGAGQIRWRGMPYAIQFCAVEIAIEDDNHALQWIATIAFTSAPLPYPLLGQAGFLEFFNQTGRGADRITVLEPTNTFPGLSI